MEQSEENLYDDIPFCTENRSINKRKRDEPNNSGGTIVIRVDISQWIVG